MVFGYKFAQLRYRFIVRHYRGLHFRRIDCLAHAFIVLFVGGADHGFETHRHNIDHYRVLQVALDVFFGAGVYFFRL